MTLVVRTRNRATPTIVGDLLVTSNTSGDSVTLPAIGSDISAFPLRSRAVGLVQKAYILADDISIVFTSNDIVEVRDLLEDFRPFCSARLLPEEIKKWVEEYDYSRFKNSSFLMTIMKDRGPHEPNKQDLIEIVHGKGFSVEEGSCFQDYRPAGSGANDFTSIVDEKRKIFTSFPDDDYRQGIVRNMAFISRFLAEERYFLRTVQNAWGGGYELVFYDGIRFKKMDNFAIVLQGGVFNTQGDVDVELPMMINHYRYRGDDLVITSVEMLNGSPRTEGEYMVWTSNNLRLDCVSVPQLRRGIIHYGTEKRPVESFETHQVGMGFAIDFGSEWFKPAFYNGNRLISIVFSPAGRRVDIRMHKSIQQGVLDMFRSSYGKFSSR